MTLRPALFIGLALSATLPALPAAAETFRWSATTDPQTMDPHAANLAPVTSFLGNIYEGLVRRGPDMALEPALATEWEAMEDGAGWRFHLREGVRFHDGTPFTADDVVFSWERGISEQSDVRSWFAPVSEVRAVGDHTVEILTNAPNPIFPDSIANWLIMSRAWAEANDSIEPARDRETAATRATNGTGPFRLVSRDPGVETRLEVNGDWWDEATHNLTEAVFLPIETSATALAALLSSEIDMLATVPVRDVERLRQADGITTFEGLETRVIMLGFAHQAETLVDTDTPNPFRAGQVRAAVAQAIDVAAIDTVLMSGMAAPASQLTPAGLSGYAEAQGARPPLDRDAARTLLADAGVGDGFAFQFKCTNDRYINDEAVCQAIVGMLAQIGLEARLEAMPVRTYWTELRAGNFDMFLLGWSPGTFDAEHPIRFLAHTPTDALGTLNRPGFPRG